MLLEPVENNAQSFYPMRWFSNAGHTVALVRENHELGLDTQASQGSEHLLALLDGCAAVVVRMHHQRRGPHVCNVLERALVPQPFHVLFGVGAKRAVPDPAVICRSYEAQHIT